MIRAFGATVKQYGIRYSRFAPLYIVLAVIAAVSNILAIRATGDMTQAASAEAGISADMMRFLLVLAAAGAVNALAESASALLRQRFYGKALHGMRGAFARRLLRLPYKDFAGKNSGEGVSLFANDVPQAAEFATVQVLSQVSQLTILVVSIVFMAFINWWLTLAYFALFPLLAVLQAAISAPIGQKSIEASERRAEFNAVVTDALQNPLTIKAYGLEASVERRYDDSYMKYFQALRDYVKTLALLVLLGVCATVTPTFALFVGSAAVVISGDMTLSAFIALTIISGPVGSWLSMFAQEMARMRQSSASAVRLLEYAPDVPESDPNAVRTHAPGGHAVVFDGATFGYDAEGAKTLEGATFAIEAGTITAIAGASGSGKSTALKLMLGLYEPDAGSVTLSTANVSYVPQDCHLLPISIKENIVCGLPFEEERLRLACENAGIYDFIRSLPEGFDAVLAESAANVSGGQRQRIAMARAFYRDAGILLFDEATSALDPATEKAVLEAFHRYVKANGKTAVLVAHRQSVLDMSDRVITLAKGGAQA
ncbi:MAG: ABC transporter transmembrane domain-containing protein [Clostridia bacterium]|nr:ABC transporter transmembrane domain-containing protein [Clostridia bacterium]